MSKRVSRQRSPGTLFERSFCHHSARKPAWDGTKCCWSLSRDSEPFFAVRTCIGTGARNRVAPLLFCLSFQIPRWPRVIDQNLQDRTVKIRKSSTEKPISLLRFSYIVNNCYEKFIFSDYVLLSYKIFCGIRRPFIFESLLTLR